MLVTAFRARSFEKHRENLKLYDEPYLLKRRCFSGEQFRESRDAIIHGISRMKNTCMGAQFLLRIVHRYGRLTRRAIVILG
jgi:hypothetical protein